MPDGAVSDDSDDESHADAPSSVSSQSRTKSLPQSGRGSTRAVSADGARRTVSSGRAASRSTSLHRTTSHPGRYSLGQDVIDLCESDGERAVPHAALPLHIRHRPTSRSPLSQSQGPSKRERSGTLELVTGINPKRLKLRGRRPSFPHEDTERVRSMNVARTTTKQTLVPYSAGGKL